MKRLLFFNSFFYPHIGGSEKSIHEICKRLAKRGYNIDIATFNTENTLISEELDGFLIYRLPCWNILNDRYPIPKPALTTFKILFKLLRVKHDLIITNCRFFATSPLGLILAKLKKTPLLHTERGAYHSVGLGKLLDLFSKTYDHTFGALIVKSAQKTIGNSSGGADFLKHLGASETIVINDGVDTNIFVKRETSLKDKLGLNNETIITYVGRLIYGKGIHDLISIFPEIKARYPAAKLLIVGEGSYKDQLETLAEKVDDENILFLGQKNSAEVAEILSITDIFVSPSYSDSFPLSIAEAGSVGIPVVASDIGGVRDIIEDYKTGLLFPLGDIRALTEKILQVLENDTLRQSLGKNACVFCREKFDWDEVADQWVREIGQESSIIDGNLKDQKYIERGAEETNVGIDHDEK